MTTSTPGAAAGGEARKRYRLTTMGKEYLAMESAIEMALETLEGNWGVTVPELLRQQQHAIAILRDGLNVKEPPERAEACPHWSATGEDQSQGYGKVYICDECGVRFRHVRDESTGFDRMEALGYAPPERAASEGADAT